MGDEGTIITTPGRNETYCVYSSDVATGYGVGAFLFLLSSESLLMGVTKCMCLGRPLTPGGNRAWATFLVAESCLIAGAKKNAYHTKYRGMIYAQNFSCESLRKGIFIAGAVFIVATMILNVYYYMYFTKATTTPLSQKTNRFDHIQTIPRLPSQLAQPLATREQISAHNAQDLDRMFTLGQRGVAAIYSLYAEPNYIRWYFHISHPYTRPLPPGDPLRPCEQEFLIE
ncbi:fiber protein fb34 precursor [Trifolium pratense]|uniref:Fiber protein fb34 n=1 Tax=Trifolium pratense TaxID=57577 RepID=A0A2K3MTS0_TRIPR|nr:fiber protein fb34 precursor [Trifolium pratense]